jgi:hypothetical protein
MYVLHGLPNASDIYIYNQMGSEICKKHGVYYPGTFINHIDITIPYNNMSQNPQKRDKDSKEGAEKSIEQTSSGDEEHTATKPVEEVAGQRDTKSADASDSADSMIV